MGLQVKDIPQPIDPTIRGAAPIVRSREADPDSIPVDISDSDLARLISFVRVLPPPGQKVPTESNELTRALAGRSHFYSLACAQCHTPSLGQVNGIFSDLLLHDMGESLEDPVPAPGLAVSTQILSAPRPGAGYYGGPVELFVKITDKEIFRSWRTPPLWGVRDSAPYMHDGRAATLHDAIVAHDGEGLTSAQNYSVLARRDQEALGCLPPCDWKPRSIIDRLTMVPGVCPSHRAAPVLACSIRTRIAPMISDGGGSAFSQNGSATTGLPSAAMPVPFSSIPQRSRGQDDIGVR